jgi:hypothetical protein
VRFSTLVNGCTSGLFRNSQGFHRGDPLYLLLLVLVIEAFSHMINMAAKGVFVRVSCRKSGK